MFIFPIWRTGKQANRIPRIPYLRIYFPFFLSSKYNAPLGISDHGFPKPQSFVGSFLIFNGFAFFSQHRNISYFDTIAPLVRTLNNQNYDYPKLLSKYRT